MASQAFLKLSKLQETSDVVTTLTESYPQGQLPHYFNALKLIKSLNTNEIFHSYFNSVKQLPVQDQLKIYDMILESQFTHYIHSTALLALSELYYAQKDYTFANDYISLLNINKVNPVEWQLDSNGLLLLKYDVYKLLISICDKLAIYGKFDEYLKKIHELLILLKPEDDLYSKLDKLHTFVLLKLNKFTEVFKKLYKANQFNELFYILLLFNINYINEINITEDIKESPFSQVFKRMKNGELVYYDTYINYLSFLLDNISQQEEENANNEDDIQLSLTNHQIIDNFKIVIFRHNLYCISQIYDNISLDNLKLFSRNNDSNSINDSRFELSDDLFDRILYDSISSGHINAKIDDIEQIIEYTPSGDNNVVNNDWNDHIVESCVLLDNIITQI